MTKLCRRAAVLTLGAMLGTGVAAAPATAAPAPPLPPSTTAPATPEAPHVGGPQLSLPGLVVNLPPGVPEPPELAAGAYLVADMDDGRVVLAKNGSLTSRPASTLKTLTALVVAPKLDAEDVIIAEHEDAAIDGSKVGVVEGEEYTAHQLLLGLMMSSGNDAANMLARANGGMEATAAEMTDLAHHLGALDTHARNASGLDADGQMTTCYDLALIGRAAVEDPHVAPYLTVRTAEFPGKRTDGPGSRRERYEINSHNRLLWNYEGTVGVKNGYTTAARQTYVGAVRRGDQAYVITYLGGTGVNWRDLAALLDWTFAHGDDVDPVGTLVEPGSLEETDDPDAADGEAGVPADALDADPPADSSPGTSGLASLDLTSGQGLLALAGGGIVLLGGAALLALHRVRRRV